MSCQICTTCHVGQVKLQVSTAGFMELSTHRLTLRAQLVVGVSFLGPQNTALHSAGMLTHVLSRNKRMSMIVLASCLVFSVLHHASLQYAMHRT